MRVLELWRYPVKSLQGEQVDRADVHSQGLAGDRGFAIFDAETGFGLTARRRPELLFASAALGPDGAVRITLPDGSVVADDAGLSAWLGRPVALRSAADSRERLYENVSDVEHEAVWEPFRGGSGAFHDSGRANVSVVSTGTMGDWARRRFRPNVVVDGAGEEALVGSRIRVGEVTLDAEMLIERCVMVTRPQPGGIEKDLEVLRAIHRERSGRLALGCTVVRPGSIGVGDELESSPDSGTPGSGESASGRRS